MVNSNTKQLPSLLLVVLHFLVENTVGDEYTYFDLGDKGWNEAYQIVQSDEQMWRINKAFLDQQKELGCEFYFSHNPFDPKIRTGFTAREIEYLTRSVEEGGLGGRINPTPIGKDLWKVEF